MADQPKSTRSTVTISKRVHQEFKVACARLGVTQRSMLERLLVDFIREVGLGMYQPTGKED